MRAPIPGGRAEGGPHQLKPTVYRYLLQLLADQSRRVPIPVLGLLIVLALIASQRMPVWIPALWRALCRGGAGFSVAVAGLVPPPRRPFATDQAAPGGRPEPSERLGSWC